MPGNFIDNSIALLEKYWYWIVIAILLILVVLLIAKSKKKPQYYNQIKDNKKNFILENSFNPTRIKYIKRLNRTWRVYDCRSEGRIPKVPAEKKEKVTKEWTPIEIKDMEYEKLKSAIKGTPEPEITKYSFTIRMKDFLKLFWYGDKEILELQPDDFTQKKESIIKLNDTIDIVYFKGKFMPMRPTMLDTCTEDSIRVQRDLEVNASGHQEHEMSRIKTEFAHAEVMKEKEIEYEKEKKRPTFSSG